MKPVDVLFVSPHPDDVEIFCGGTVATLAVRHAVMIADLTRGELASNGTPEGRRADSLRAAARLGAAQERPVLDLPDGGVDDRDEAQVDVVVALLRRVRPATVFAPWPHDRHPDHEAAGRLVRRAVFLAGLSRHRDDLGTAHRVRTLLFYPCHREVEVDLLVDVGDSMDAWREAVACYASQFVRDAASAPTPINRPGFLVAHEGRRATWGALVGVDFAEAFVHEGPWLLASASEFVRRGGGA